MNNGTEAHPHTESTFHMLSTKNIMVTGAAGYIGGQICINLKDRVYNVIAVDLRRKDHLLGYYDEFLQNDISSSLCYKLINDYKPRAIIHCAGTSLVGPSLQNPENYFHNNVEKSHQLMNVIKNTSPSTRFIFSSSAAVYGVPESSLTEHHATDPISPYGESKLMVEKMLRWYYQAHGLNHVIFRYFNACGADMYHRHGQEPGSTHIFARLFETAAEQDGIFTLNGMDYNTPDGTCVRDYVHVSDIADAHIHAIEKDLYGVYNISTSTGLSNLQIQTQVENYLGKKLVTEIGPRREGDPDTLVAMADKLQKSGFNMRYNLYDIIESLYGWYGTHIYNNQRTLLDIQPS